MIATTQECICSATIDLIQFCRCSGNLGMVARSPHRGPEWDLVSLFVEQIPDTFSTDVGSTEWAVFYEPAVPTGFPDLVLAEYDPCIYENWSQARLKLSRFGVRALDLLHAMGGLTSEGLSQRLGIRGKMLLTTLEQLLDADLLERHDGLWQMLDPEGAFGLKRLVAIEAKISNWRSVFQQAQTDKWFASESYVLLPIERATNNILQHSLETGVGIYLCNSSGVQEVRSSDSKQLPACHASWYFNEWIGRKRNKNVDLATTPIN